MPINEIGKVYANSLTAPTFPLGLTAGEFKEGVIDASGAMLVMDFYMKAMLAGCGFQVRAGTITTPLVGDVAITDTAAEIAIDPPAGSAILLNRAVISIRLGTGTLHEYAIKSVTGASSAGAAYVPLPLIIGGRASGCTARVEAAGAVTVTAELATTTRRHWSFSQPIAMGAYNGPPPWEPRAPVPILGGACLYTQIAATTTGPSYYANEDYLEFTRASLGI